MNHTEIQEMSNFEKTYWWHVGKKRLVVALMDTYVGKKDLKILEIGSGGGEISKELLSYGKVYANDISDYALQLCKEKGVSGLILGDITELDLSKYHETFDVVLALDVLEHIQDDVKAIQVVKGLLKPGGTFLINVPAYKFLWSAHDEVLHHKRRYTGYEISMKLSTQGFSIIKKTHFVFFMFPVMASFKFFSNFISRDYNPKTAYIKLPDSLNSLMVKILEFEILLLKKFNLPFGTTLSVVAKKL